VSSSSNLNALDLTIQLLIYNRSSLIQTLVDGDSVIEPECEMEPAVAVSVSVAASPNARFATFGPQYAGLIKMGDAAFMPMPAELAANCATYHFELVQLALPKLWQAIKRDHPDASRDMFDQDAFNCQISRYRRLQIPNPYAEDLFGLASSEIGGPCPFDVSSPSPAVINTKRRKLSKARKGIVPPVWTVPRLCEFEGEVGHTVRTFSVWHFGRPVPIPESSRPVKR
jgi:hypothetical protein